MATVAYKEAPPAPKTITFLEFAQMPPGTLGQIEKPTSGHHGVFVVSLSDESVASPGEGHYWAMVTRGNFLRVRVLPPNSTLTLTQEDI